MSDLQVRGTITSISEVKEGTTKAGAAYKAMSFLVDNGEEYNNLFSFDLYQGDGKDNIDKFIQYNSVGMLVDVKFNIRTSEYQGRHFTSLSAWSIFKAEGDAEGTGDDLPF